MNPYTALILRVHNTPGWVRAKWNDYYGPPSLPLLG